MSPSAPAQRLSPVTSKCPVNLSSSPPTALRPISAAADRPGKSAASRRPRCSNRFQTSLLLSDRPTERTPNQNGADPGTGSQVPPPDSGPHRLDAPRSVRTSDRRQCLHRGPAGKPLGNFAGRQLHKPRPLTGRRRTRPQRILRNGTGKTAPDSSAATPGVSHTPNPTKTALPSSLWHCDYKTVSAVSSWFLLTRFFGRKSARPHTR